MMPNEAQATPLPAPDLEAQLLSMIGSREPPSGTNVDLIGIDTAGPIMQKLIPVGDNLQTRLRQIIDKAQAMLELIGTHQQAVEQLLMTRDDTVRAMIEKHAKLAGVVTIECDRIEKAMEAITLEFGGTTLKASEPVIQERSYRASDKGDGEEGG